MQLRPYQSETIDALHGWWKERPSDYPLVVLPTAAGKTVVFSTLIKQLLEQFSGLRVMVLAHTRELVEQAGDKLSRIWEGAPVGVYCAGLGRKEIRQITVASRDSIRSVAGKVGRFDMVLIDEAHLISTREDTSYRKIIDALKEQSPGLTVVGFTATPFRMGSGYIYGKDRIFADIAYSRTIRDLMNDGYLCPITAKAVDDKAVASGEGLKVTGGDFNKKELAALVERDAIVSASVAEWYKLAYEKGRKASAFFCASVAHAQMVSDELAAVGVHAPVVTGDSDKKERAQILKDFEAGKLTAICNVACLTTGWDAPVLDCLVLLRPTRSLALFIQIVGRGLRLHPEKENTLLLDFGENLERFGPIDLAKPAGRKREDKRTKQCPECSEIVGFYKRKCLCGFEFEPQPVKDCPECGAELHPSAARCDGCGYVFVKHESKASTLAVFSDGATPVLEELPVKSIRLFERITKAGTKYLQVGYQVSDFDFVRRAMCFDAPRNSPKYLHACQIWQEISVGDCATPTSVDLAMGWYRHSVNSGQQLLKAAKSVVLNQAVKGRPVMMVKY